MEGKESVPGNLPAGGFFREGRGFQLRSDTRHCGISTDRGETLQELIRANPGMTLAELLKNKIMWFVGHEPFLEPLLHDANLLEALKKRVSGE